MPCNPISVQLPDGPSGPSIPGFGKIGALDIPNLTGLLPGIPEDLVALLQKFQLLMPAGIFKPALNPNFGKDAFDSIMKLMDMLFPFLMLYKFFLPLLNLIICIIEVLCALKNPFKLIKAVRRLFRKCLPAFLNLFPIFALIAMIISLLLLLLAFIKYIIDQITKFIKAILRNIFTLNKAITTGDDGAVLKIAYKFAALMCVFQNLFVLLSIFAIIINLIRDILKTTISKPCSSKTKADENCCGTDVCPSIVNNTYTKLTGQFQYYNGMQYIAAPLPPPFNVGGGSVLRQEAWQLFDLEQVIQDRFINIVDGYDVDVTPKPNFFPTDSMYDANTNPSQAAYTIDLRLLYDPALWGRTGYARFVNFKDCIVIKAPTTNLVQYDTNGIYNPNGVLLLVGGKGTEDNGNILTGFAADGVTPIATQANLNNFLHKPDYITNAPSYLATDQMLISNVTYTFKPNFAVLFSKDLVTAGCDPAFAFDRDFFNETLAGDATFKLDSLQNLFNSPGNGFPDLDAAQLCLSTALDSLRNDVTVTGAAQFQTTSLLCLNKLQKDTSDAISSLVTLGYDACSSSFSLDPKLQFTTKTIKVTVDLKDKNGTSIVNGIDSTLGAELAKSIKGYPTLGTVDNFIYDGYQYFTSSIASDKPGSGSLMISFDDQIFCNNVIPDNDTIPASRTLQSIDYKFIYAPYGGGGGFGSVPTAEGDTDGNPARNESNLSNG